MKDVYTIDDLQNWSDETIRLGVIGDPVAHSLSPQMMNAALEHCGLPHRYACFHIRPTELGGALQLMRDREFVGVNLTLPHKVAALELMDCVNDVVDAVGAVNTVQFRHGKLRGFNTDAIGFTKAVREAFDIDASKVRVLIFGGGGASRAIAFACDKPRVWTRRDSTDLRLLAREADLIVNATPVGLNDDDMPLLRRDDLRANQFVFDTIYEPVRTKLLDEAAAAGAQVANGLSMLLHQGAAAFGIWFNRPAPLDIMSRALGGSRPPGAI